MAEFTSEEVFSSFLKDFRISKAQSGIYIFLQGH